jgi:hypothetical protein
MSNVYVCFWLFVGGDAEDIIDETLSYFRANVLFRFFDFKSLSDRTMVYLTTFTQLCLTKLEKIEDKPSG